MLKFLNLSQIIIAIILTVSILLQNRGAGLSRAFGGDMGGYYTRRGFEKFLVVFSIILSALFIILAITNLVITSKNSL